MTDRPAQSPGFSTRAIHRAVTPEVSQQPSSVPLYQTSTWRFESLDDFAEVIGEQRPGFVYGRGYGNPTVEAFETVMADLEGTDSAFAFDSGMAAIHAVITSVVRSGERMVASRWLYGGTYSLFRHLLPRYGIEVTLVDIHDLDAVAAALPGASLLYVETIDNPLVSVADLGALGRLGAEVGVPTVVDNTFASPYLCTPASFGVDYVVHSATKYLGGHSDLVGGVVCCGLEARAALRAVALDLGSAMQPLEAWLCLRGVATLALRMERHCATAERVAALLSSSPAVSTVYYPGLASHPSHQVASRQLQGAGGLLSFELAGGLEAARRFCGALRLAWIAASLGGAHTLVAHPATTTHRQVSREARQTQGLSDGLIRMSVGLEDPDDVVADVEQGLVAASP
ncbi:MAG: aminotransferase class I/II-fold pyridoxal phosphate-dependent enzyme [Acidimicrobiales bacterium]|nr:aminotransferase class I/II-fold pyridoxal phosphate-dependent enzyme [Acidimicrobiales bacterium]